AVLDGARSPARAPSARSPEAPAGGVFRRASRARARGHRAARVEPATPLLHAGPRRRHGRPRCARHERVRLPPGFPSADARHVRASRRAPRAPPRAVLPIRAESGGQRRRLRDLLLLGGGVPRRGGRFPRRGALPFRGHTAVRQRSRVVRRRDRRGHRRAARQFPAGVHAPRPDRCGARARGARPRGRRETDTRSPFGGATMNWGSWLIWGFASTVVLTTILAGSQGLGLTRMNLPYM